MLIYYLGWPAGLGDENGDISDIEVLHREVGRIDHGVEDIGVVEEGVGVDLLLGRSEGFEERILNRNKATILHKYIVRIEIHHQRRSSSRQE